MRPIYTKFAYSVAIVATLSAAYFTYASFSAKTSPVVTVQQLDSTVETTPVVSTFKTSVNPVRAIAIERISDPDATSATFQDGKSMMIIVRPVGPDVCEDIPPASK